MIRLHVSLAAGLLLGASPFAGAAEPELPENGWVSWEVPAVADAPYWCCWGNWDQHRSKAAPRTCDLDEGSRNTGSRDDETTDAIRIYARVTQGKLDRLQAFAASCPVQAKTPIAPLQDVSTEDSVRWLSARIVQGNPGRRSLAEDAMAALAMHDGESSARELTRFARHDASEQRREWAVFWLAIVRGLEGAEVVRSVMFEDKSPGLRKHAAFAMSQSKSPRKAQELIRQGKTDADGDVRAQAWFWLAQTGDVAAEPAIGAALRTDSDDHVREHAIFALSQLPEERAIRALIAAAEDRSLSREQRKRAVFWLSQSGADSAQSYLEKLLARTAPP